MQDNLAVDEDRKGASVVQRIQKNQVWRHFYVLLQINLQL